MLLIEEIGLILPPTAGRLVAMCQYQGYVLLATERGLFKLVEDGIGGYSAVKYMVARLNELENRDAGTS
jgi:cyanate permease